MHNLYMAILFAAVAAYSIHADEPDLGIATLVLAAVGFAGAWLLHLLQRWIDRNKTRS